MNISLTKHYDDYVEKKVQSGRYESKSEVVRAALRLMESIEARQGSSLHAVELEAKLLEGLSSPATPLTGNDWKNLRNRVRKSLSRPREKD